MFVIQAGFLIDGVLDKAKPRQAIFIEDGKIRHVCPLDEATIPPGTKVVNHLNGYVMPGLIDCHIHITFTGAADLGLQRNDPEATLALRAAHNAKKTLEAGFTTVRSLGSKYDVDIQLRRAIADGLIVGPRIIASGRCIAITGGHGHEGGIEADGPWEVRKAVRTVLKAGADVVKVMATGGVLTEGVEPGSPEFSLEELTAAATEAHRTGAKIATHAHGKTGIRNAVLAGIDTIEHGVYLDEEIIQLMLERGTALVPTLSAPLNINLHGVAGGIPKWAVEKSLKISEYHFQNFRKAYDAGLLIGLGTDAGTPFNYHGQNAQELELMVQAGMTPMAALKAGTSMAAKIIGMDDKLGQIAPGYLADLLLLEGNPLEDLSLFRDPSKIKSVYLGGVEVV